MHNVVVVEWLAVHAYCSSKYTQHLRILSVLLLTILVCCLFHNYFSVCFSDSSAQATAIIGGEEKKGHGYAS